MNPECELNKIKIESGRYDAEIGNDVIIRGPVMISGTWYSWWVFPSDEHRKDFAKLLREIADCLEGE